MKRCSHIFWRGKERGQQCSRMTKGQKCHKHKGCQDDSVAANEKVAKLQSDEVFGSNNEDQAIPKGKLKSSIYLITINSNKTLESMSSAEKKQFKDFVEFVFSQDNLKDNYIVDNHGLDVNGIIESFELESHFEVSPKTNRIHCHIYINIQHRGHISFRIDDIRALAAKIFPDKIYISFSVSSDPTIAMKNYTRKMSGQSVNL